MRMTPNSWSVSLTPTSSRGSRCIRHCISFFLVNAIAGPRSLGDNETGGTRPRVACARAVDRASSNAAYFRISYCPRVIQARVPARRILDNRVSMCPWLVTWPTPGLFRQYACQPTTRSPLVPSWPRLSRPDRPESMSGRRPPRFLT